MYDLAGVSGKTVMEHPETKRMLADIKRGHIAAIIFSKLARLARNTRELLEFSEFFRAAGADMVSLQEKIDTSTPAGRLFYTMIAAMAQWEREEITERIRASVAIRAKLGKPLNATAPYGYRWKDKKLVLNPEEAPIRKRAYDLFLEHRRIGTVARLLNEAGYRTRTGAVWSDMAVGRILVHPSAKGTYFFNTIKKTGDWQSEEKPESEWCRLSVDSIVSEDVWNRANELIEARRKKSERPGKKPAHLFSGILVCACGTKMYVPSNSPKYICTKCRNKIPADDLEAIFYSELKAYFGAPERIATHLENAQKNVTEKEQLLAAHKREMGKLRDEIARTHRLYLDGQIRAENFSSFFRPMDERLTQLQAELPRLEAEVDHLKIGSLSADEILNEAKSLYGRWPQLASERKRQIIESLVESITIGGDEIDIKLSHLPSSEEMTDSQQRLPAP